jgi:7-cyano-7-deazaguanine synthase
MAPSRHEAATPVPVDGAGRAAVVLLSGGLDSAVTLAWMRASGFRCAALSFDYGQRHRVELGCAARVARSLGVTDHRVVPVDLRAFGGSALTADIAVPKDRDVASAHDIPVTYVPARNTIFLSMALGLAEVLDARDLALGVNALDYSGYPDCRPEFVHAFERLANLATKAGVEAIAAGTTGFLSKTEIIGLGARLGVDFGLTSSCYDPRDDGAPCGRCDSCQLRARGFAEAGLRDGRVG